MSTYRTNGSPVKRTRKAKQPKQPRQKDLTKYLTLDYVRRALAVIDHRLARNDSQTAKYVLEMYFGKAGVSRIQAEKLAAEAKTPATRKPNLRLTNEFFDKLAQKYFPKPNWDASSDGSNQTGKGPGEGKPEAGS